MVYKAENIDTDKFLKQLDWLKEFDRQKEREETITAKKYHEGYRECLEKVKDVFYCSNYEKTIENSVEKVEEER